MSAIDLSRKNTHVLNERDSLNELKKSKMDILILCANKSLPKMLVESLV